MVFNKILRYYGSINIYFYKVIKNIYYSYLFIFIALLYEFYINYTYIPLRYRYKFLGIVFC